MPLKSLALDAGTGVLAKDVVSSPEDLERIKAIIKQEIKKHPELAKVIVNTKSNFPNAYYNFSKNDITTGLSNPDAIAHEVGHAVNTQNEPIYQKLLLASRALLMLSKKSAVPIMLGMRAFVSDPNKRDEILNILSGISAAAAAPSLMEEASASANAVMGSDDKLHTLKVLLPALGEHVLHDLMPSIAFQVGRRI